MNDSGESPKETADRKMKVLSAKWKTRIGFWNLKTIYEKGKPVKSKADVRRYNLHFLGISVSRWAGLGRHKSNTGETVLYSGADDQHHKRLVIIFKKGREKCLMEWKLINSRLIKVRLKGRHINTAIIQCYAPTNDVRRTARTPSQTTSSRPRKHATSWDENFDAKSWGKCWEWQNELRKGMGREGCGIMNDNGERLLDICTAFDFQCPQQLQQLARN